MSAEAIIVGFAIAVTVTSLTGLGLIFRSLRRSEPKQGHFGR